MGQLLDGLVPGLPDELKTRIRERAEGIPLYAVETVRMMLDRGVLVQDGPVYRPAGPITELEVPETLHALIAARLDGLERPERTLVQDAAVLGKTFTRQALATLSGLSEDALEPLLRALVRKEILAVQADPRSPEYGQYSFVQDLLRHVAYETLTKQERRGRHLAAAAYLSGAFPDEDEVVEVVASHYLNAYRAAPEAEDAAEIKVKAREMLARAGERAASLAAAREAQRYFEQAAELAEDKLTHAQLEERAAVMAWRRGRSHESRVLFERAIDEFERAGLVRPAARAATALAEIDFNEGKPLDAVDRLKSALETLTTRRGRRGRGPRDGAARAVPRAGRANRRRHSLSRAGAYAVRGLRPAGDLHRRAHQQEPVSRRQPGRLGECQILLEAAIERAEAQDLPRAAARALNNLGVIFESADRFSETLAITDRALAHAARAGDQSWELMLRSGKVSSLVLVGRWGEAIETADELARSPHGHQVASMLGCALEIDCRRGDVERAKERLSSVTDESEDPQVRASHALYKAIVLRAEGDPAAALEALQPALDARESLGIRFLTVKLAIIEELECASALGDAARIDRVLEAIDELRPGDRRPLLTAHAARFRARRTTDASEAEREFRGAAEIFRDHHLVFWLAVTQLEHAELLVEHGRSDDAEPLLAEARETFERLEAHPWLERALASRPLVEEPA